MALLFPAGQQFFGSNGKPLASGSLTFYATTTTTPKAVYSDIGLDTAVANPYSLDAAGRIAVNLYVPDGDLYTVLAKSSTGTTVWSRDDVFGWGDGTPYYPRTAAEIAAGVTPADYSKFPEPADIRRYGAVADGGATDNYAAIQAALDVAAIGGGSVYVPGADDFYGYETILSFPSNVTMFGDGPSSHLVNTNVANEWAASLMAFGNYGGYNTAFGPFAETAYSIDPLTESDRAIDFQTAGESANFASGDLVLIYDPNNTGGTFPYMQVNEVINVGTGTLTLKHPHPYDVTKAGATELKIAKANAAENISDIDGRAAQCIRNSHLRDLKFTQSYTTGRQGIHVAAYECSIERCIITAHRCVIGNPFAFCTVRDTEMRYYSEPVEMAQFCGPFLFENCTYVPALTTWDANAAILMNAGGYGARIVGGEAHGCRVLSQKDETEVVNLKLYDSTATGIQLSSPRGGGKVSKCLISTPATNGILVDEPHTICSNNIVRGIGSAYYSIKAGTSSDYCVFDGNDVLDSYAEQNVLFDENGRATTNLYRGNLSRLSVTGYPFQSDTAHTGTTAPTTIASKSFPANALARKSSIRVRAEGNLTGAATNGTKHIRLKAGGSTVSTITLAAGETGSWRIDAYVQCRNSYVLQRSYATAFSEANGIDHDDTTSSVDTTANAFEVLVEVELTNASDDCTVYWFDAEMVNDQFEI